MKRTGRRTIAKRRRREGKTDYLARLKLLESGLPRLVIRKSNLYIYAQIVESKEAQDFVIVGATSKELEKYGWKFSKKNLPASYLTCFLLINKLKKKKKKLDKAILDMGLNRSIKGSRIYACLKGALDAGLDIPHNSKMLPKEERIKGFHINQDVEKNFEDVKKRIREVFK